MDTGVTAHLHADPGILHYVRNNAMNPFVYVENGSRIPVSATGDTHLPFSYSFRPLRLNSVLITPDIIKNLVSVRRFARDNKCSIEFDEFGFSVHDFQTKRTLLQCDSTGNLYPVMKPST